MAGMVVTTEETFGSVKKISFDWLSSAGGAADATTTYIYNGQLLRMVLFPDAAGTQPTDQYDVLLNDADGYDLLNGQGANCSNAATHELTVGLGAVAGDALTLGVTNAGNATGGIVTVYLR